MTPEAATVTGLLLYLAGVVAAFGIRTWMHRRRTGSTGWRGLSGRPGSAEWWGGTMFAAAMLLGAAGPALAVAGVGPARVPLPSAVAWVGLVAGGLGFVGTLAAQAGMGASWRIGVDPAERTTLVTGGVFAVVRNPIFTAMATALVGVALLAPTAVTLAALVSLVVAVQLQVRVVEEPYLRHTHGAAYVDYTARVGRFVPGVGRARTRETEESGTRSP
ncbi:methyltransferase family protein [Cellulomonas dongxiuzhuiae]|uniref:Isoprenylcysteine carboxylmethyltransferase family protein n=1 Tax=Cellulomonas dongxiuzhuiae TaxID=2819979 RepID=A0ABX8GK05_9CELL|nr:isoprenylcysteine carboxylmethyltransferase family protein [Cellulomonas dongxiuzhuiae]MBO3095538.1 isoprenylcysteine carboxylmethyltransferase family protein [Cellulomonas dongxiuzhuiae]QWC16514.1 isoprenylcysteine carboxylmethyltransferase family protein [Cellulomonas dongxiuzhuiae]